MTVKSLNNTFRDLASGDNLSPSQKDNLLTQYNSNISGIQNQLGYKPTYGATTNPSRSLVQVVATAQDTSGNGGRKLVRLNNGNEYIVTKDSANIYLHKSTNTGSSFSQVATVNHGSIQDVCLTTNGSKVYVLVAHSNNTVRMYFVDDTAPAFSANTTIIDSSQTALGTTSLTYSPTDNSLHATWASKNATYANSFNIRYAKGTIANDGSVSWSTVTQVTTTNTAGNDVTNPTIVVKSNGYPIIIVQSKPSANYYIDAWLWNGSSFASVGVNGIYNGSTFAQSSPSATVDGNGVIHVVWHGLDATDTIVNNIRYSKSTDGGVTFSAMLKLTSGNSYTQQSPSITYDTNNNLYVYWQGYTSTSTSKFNIRSIVYNGTSWSSIVETTNQATNDMKFPSLCDNLRTFTSPLVIWQDNVSPSVKFSGTWTDTPIIAETVTTSAVSNKALIDAVISKGIGARVLTGTVTSNSSTSIYTYISGTTGNMYSITVTGLPFKPIFIQAFTSSGGSTYTSTYSELSGEQYPKTLKMVGYFGNASNTSAISYHMKGDVSPASITNGSFTIPVQNASVTYTWIAFG